MPTVTIYFEHDIVATATGKVIRRGLAKSLDTVIELKDRPAMNSVGLARGLFDARAKQSAKEDFIAELRSDTRLKREIGGTKWEVQLRAHATVHPTREHIVPFYKDVVAGRIKIEDNMEIMLQAILDSLSEAAWEVGKLHAQL